LELTRDIWDGHDYVPYVWDEWLADPQGLLAVVEWGGRVLGLSKISRLSPNEWWLQGLRVHPEFQGRGFASHLFDYCLEWWERWAGGILRFATASFRLSVQHLAGRTRFRKLGEFSIFGVDIPADTAGDGETSSQTGFEPLAGGEVPEALAFVQASPALPLSYGLLDLGWAWVAPSAYTMAQIAARGQAWWWRRRDGLLLAYEDEEDGQNQLSISLAARPPERLADLLQEARRLAAVLGYSRLGWLAPLHPAAQLALDAAGFNRDWDASVYVYARER
jgi:GNAT superfamily N-acetyltransferase